MFCEKCGADKKENSNFCDKCGYQFNQYYNENYQEENENNNNKYKLCKTCKQKIDIDAEKCPYCHTTLNFSVLRVSVAVIIVIIIVIWYGLNRLRVEKEVDEAIDNYNEEIDDIYDTYDEPENQFELVDYRRSGSEYLVYIVGTIKNNSNKNYSYASVSFDTYDKQGNRNGSCSDYISNFKAGQSWKYEAICNKNNSEIYKYELDEISGTKEY